MYEVAEICGDAYMIECLRESMIANREAQARLSVIELHAGGVKG